VAAARGSTKAKEPVRAVVYIAYSLAVGFTLLAILAAARSERRSGRRSRRRAKVAA
jgi:hypothetical protein